MSINNNSYNEKLKNVLKVFMTPKCRIKNDVYLEMLLTHLSGKHNKEYKNILRLPFIIEWIEQSTAKLSDEDETPSLPIVGFTLRLLALVIEDEWRFAEIKDKNMLDSIQSSLNNNKNLQKPSIKLANIILLSAVSKHSIGLHWIKQTSSWRTVIEYCQKNHTLYVVREAMTFLYDILDKFSNYVKDEQTTYDILNEICKTLPKYKEEDSDCELSIIKVDDSEYQQKITPTLNLIAYILEKCVINSEGKDLILNHLIETCKLDLTMWKLADMSHDHLFLEIIFRIFVLINFARLNFRNKNSEESSSDIAINRFVLNFFNYMNFVIARRSGTNIIKIAELNHIIWKKLGNRVPQECKIDNQQVRFKDQFTILQLFPLLCFIKKDYLTSDQQTEYVHDYILKIFNISSEHTVRLCYSFRDFLNIVDNSDDLACKSIQSILSIKSILDRETAVLVFQALIYSLKGYTPDICGNISGDKNYNIKTDRLTSKPNLLSAILSGMHTLISFYKITWKECIESITLLNFMLALLENVNLTTRLAVQALKLAQLAIEHFLAPNLALLIDSLQGSTIEKLGPMIMKRLHDINWEIRDSTLELLSSMVVISSLKYPAFQQHILSNNICSVVFIIAKNDSESFVRASALKCMTEMFKIKLFWEKYFSTVDIMGHVIAVVGGESEGIVRREAVELLNILYDEQKIPRNYLDKVFSHMAYCCVNDLYWEVKTSALTFWRIALCRQCNHQGMIDGTFPSITFSIEHKKIVTLTHKEIILRLRKLLDEFSLRGGLGVFLTCLDDDCDLQVVKTAVSIIKQLIDILKKHNYMEDCDKILSSTPSRVSVIDTNYSEFKNVSDTKTPLIRNDADTGNDVTSEKETSDEIINKIVELDDINLLTHAYETRLNVNSLNELNIKDDYYKKFYIEPNEFLTKIMQMDLDEKIKMKSDWILENESFNSLLDDILLFFSDINVNDADCY